MSKRALEAADDDLDDEVGQYTIQVGRFILQVCKDVNEYQSLLAVFTKSLTSALQEINLNESELYNMTESFSIMDEAEEKKLAKVKVQCHGITSKKSQCTRQSVEGSLFCPRHGGVTSELRQHSDDTKLVRDMFNNLKPGQVVLRKQSNGHVYWPGTNYRVKSLTEQYVFAKTVNKELLPLTVEDAIYLESNHIPYRMTSFSPFRGETAPPKQLVDTCVKEMLGLIGVDTLESVIVYTIKDDD